jgi:hypothetical protein
VYRKELRMNIAKVTARQFEKILNKEGKTVIDLADGRNKRIVFKRTSAKNSQEKIVIAYPQEYGWSKGSIIKYKDMYFLIINRDAFESDVYYTSTAIKCNCIWYINDKEYYLVAGDLSSVNPRNGTYIDSTNGSINLYTTKSDMVNEGDKVFDFDGTFECINRFTIDGLTYYYFVKTETNTSGWKVDFGTNKTTYSIKDELKYNATLVNSSGKYYMPSKEVNRTVTFTSSNEEVATVDQNGVVTFVSTGDVTISCEITMENAGVIITGTGYQILTIKTPEDTYAKVKIYKKDPYTGEYNREVEASTDVRWGMDYRVESHYYNKNDVEDKSKIPTWTITDTEYGVIYKIGSITHTYTLNEETTYTSTATITVDGINVFVDVAANGHSKCFYYNPLRFTATYEDGTKVTYIHQTDYRMT